MRRIKLKAQQPDVAVVADAVAAIRSGALVALPTETVYGLAANPDDPASVARLRETKGSPGDRPFTHHVATPQQVETLAPPPPRRIQRMLERYWPGPVTAVLPGRADADVGVRMPAHPFTAAVLERFPRGLYLSSANPAGAPPATSPDEVAAAFPGLDALFDAGVAPLGFSSTVVHWQPPALRVLREGTLTREEVLHAAAATVLFVCTGNTCRSPLAEAMARRALARRMGVTEPEVLERGLRVVSAGMAAATGLPASEHAITVAAEIGLDLSQHRTRLLDDVDPDTVMAAYGMSPAHVLRLGAIAPEFAGRIELLEPHGHEVPDPFGGELEHYRAARDVILRSVEARVDEMLALLDRA